MAVFGALNIGVGIADLNGRLLTTHHESWDIAAGPVASLNHASKILDEMLTAHVGAEIWGVTIGVPGPVDFATARPVSPPIMPGWNGFDIRGWFEDRYDAPVWVDNDVNLMAIGEFTHSPVEGAEDLLFVKVGTGIGAGLISSGHVHRGANGGAGDVGHIIVTEAPDVVCRCGQTGCLEAIAGGWALARDAQLEASEGRSLFLAERLTEKGTILPIDVADGARAGDPVCTELVAKSGRWVGENVASMVSFFNPSFVAIGGTIAETGDQFLAAVRQTVYRRSLPLATRNLQIIPASLEHSESLVGAAQLALEQVFEISRLQSWISEGSPARAPRAAFYV
ncbi:ROK family protein [Leifsonia sp. NPDC058194]|uniref:ROK family protein n=1 Tax=Leifsonia sp. NPDC058194 TaxID=3346374 RepID=UPI0036D890AF